MKQAIGVPTGKIFEGNTVFPNHDIKYFKETRITFVSNSV